MIDEQTSARLSELADGQLASDQANELLLNVLDDAAGRAQLKAMLRLRRATGRWRNVQPGRPVLVVADRPGAGKPRGRRRAWRLGGLALAACVGGLLVLAGVWVERFSPTKSVESAKSTGNLPPAGRGPDSAQPVVRVTREQMQQVASILALQESVAGPLAYYAADDQNITLAPARGAGAQSLPIAIRLTLAPTTSGEASRTYLIICREQQPAVIELPAESPGGMGLRVYVTPRAINNHIEVQYAIAVERPGPQAIQASLAGERRVGLTETSLGQLAVGDTLMNVEAAAWAMRQEPK